MRFSVCVAFSCTHFLFADKKYLITDKQLRLKCDVLYCKILRGEKMKRKNTSVIKNNLYFLGLIWKIQPMSIISYFFVDLIEYGFWVFYSVIFMQYLFGAEGGLRSFTQTVSFILIALFVNIIARAFCNWYWNVYNIKSTVRIRYGLNMKLFNKAQSVDVSCFENPEFYNTYTKAATEASDRAVSVIQNCSETVGSIISSMYVIITMALITPWSLVFIALPLFANLYMGKRLAKLSFKENEETTKFRRRVDYVDRIIYFRKYAGELRLTNIYSVLEGMFKKSTDDIVDVKMKYAFKYAVMNITKSVLMFLLGYEGMWLCAAVLALNGTISISQAIVLINAITSVSWMLNNLERATTETSKNAFFIENLKTFLNFTPKIDEAKGGLQPPSTVETIEFKNVSFGYSGQSNLALKNINLVMKKGVRHALVGINGSGKSTLIKLIMRFYDPTEGEILLNGINIKEFDINKYRGLIGAAFQDFALFSATVGENVMLRELENIDDNNQVISALSDSDVYAKVSTLDKGINAVLTREFDDNGVELSGGEKQKIAIARAFAKKSPIVILDEPSSALDPIAEYKMFETVNRLCEGENKLSVIVSHRLSSAAMCDKLFVFENGMLLEEGTHSELLNKNGIYSDMFYKQARNYTAGEVCAI